MSTHRYINKHYRRRHRISDAGTRIVHNLGVKPLFVSCEPVEAEGGLVCYSVHQYAEPTARYVYLKSTTPADFLVYIGG